MNKFQSSSAMLGCVIGGLSALACSGENAATETLTPEMQQKVDEMNNKLGVSKMAVNAPCPIYTERVERSRKANGDGSDLDAILAVCLGSDGRNHGGVLYDFAPRTSGGLPSSGAQGGPLLIYAFPNSRVHPRNDRTSGACVPQFAGAEGKYFDINYDQCRPIKGLQGDDG